MMAASRRAAFVVWIVSRSFPRCAAVFGAALLAANAPAKAQQSLSPPEARVIVIGEGSVSEAPDYAQIRAGVTTRAATAKEAVAANSKIMSAITAALRDAAIEAKDIQTARFSLQPVYTPAQPNTQPRLSGFNVANQVSVTVRQLDRLGDVLDRLVGAGANDVGNIEFLHSDPTKALDRARQAAIADARRKAELYARASGLALGRTAFITENPDEGPVAFSPAAARTAKLGVPVAVGEDTLRVVVTVGFDTAP